MAVKNNVFSVLAGVFAPSLSQRVLIKREALSMGYSVAESKRLAKQAYAGFRNARLARRWTALMDQNPLQLRAWIRQNAQETPPTVATSPLVDTLVPAQTTSTKTTTTSTTRAGKKKVTARQTAKTTKNALAPERRLSRTA